MRLHSTAIELLGKEPWKYRKDVYVFAKEWLNLRHKMIPYLFTMDYRTHKEGIALCEPMYYSYPEHQNAYNFKNQYMFGSELMVCPITSSQNPETNMGEVSAWIPKGRWTDIFTDQSYEGDKIISLHRDIDTIPVLAKEGAIVPFSKPNGNDTSNPKELEIWIYSGNNRFALYEDNGKTDYEKHNCNTFFNMSYDEEKAELHFGIDYPVGDTKVIPENRTFRLIFKDLDTKSLKCNCGELFIDENKNAVVEIGEVIPIDKINLTLTGAVRKSTSDVKEKVVTILSRWQEGTLTKSKVYKYFENAQTRDELRTALHRATLPHAVSSAINEVLEVL